MQPPLVDGHSLYCSMFIDWFSTSSQRPAKIEVNSTRLDLSKLISRWKSFSHSKMSCNKELTDLFAGGQEHLEQVQRGGGEATAHLRGAGLRLCIRDHFKLRLPTSGPRFSRGLRRFYIITTTRPWGLRPLNGLLLCILGHISWG